MTNAEEERRNGQIFCRRQCTEMYKAHREREREVLDCLRFHFLQLCVVIVDETRDLLKDHV